MRFPNRYQNRAWLEISKRALLGNLAALRKVIGRRVKIAAVVKANAYGHGLEDISKILETRVEFFAVDNLTEALTLKGLGVKKPIIILGYTRKDALQDVLENELSLVVYDKETLEKIVSLKNPRKARIHLKIETGLNRQGIKINHLHPLLKFIKSNKKYILLEGVYTHFANIEDTLDSSFAENQLLNFKEALSVIRKNGIKPQYLHSAASAATLLYEAAHFNMVRIGVSLYGLWPSRETKIALSLKGRKVNLSPVLSWKSIIAQIKSVEKGESVGYGRTWFAARRSLIAIVPIGYSDGYDRKLSNNSRVLINGSYAPVVGRVAMNMIMVDVTGIRSLKKEDKVTLLGTEKGKSITADDLAERIGTINYEVVSRISPLLPKMVVD